MGSGALPAPGAVNVIFSWETQNIAGVLTARAVIFNCLFVLSQRYTHDSCWLPTNKQLQSIFAAPVQLTAVLLRG
jgi:hypothetical protein